MVLVCITGTRHFEGGRKSFPSWSDLMAFYGADNIITEDDSEWFELRGKYRVQGRRFN